MYHRIRLVPRRLPRAKRAGWLVSACSDGVSDERSESDGPQKSKIFGIPQTLAFVRTHQDES
jgi:hypothetical protein